MARRGRPPEEAARHAPCDENPLLQRLRQDAAAAGNDLASATRKGDGKGMMRAQAAMRDAHRRIEAITGQQRRD